MPPASRRSQLRFGITPVSYFQMIHFLKLKTLAFASAAISIVSIAVPVALAQPAWTITQLPAQGQFPPRFLSVSCPSESLCVAAGSVNQQAAIAVSTNPAGGPEAWTVATLSGSEMIRGITCPSPSLCVAVDSHGDVLSSTNPAGGAAAWTIAPISGSGELFGISCTPSAFCVAVGNGGTILTSTNPTGGASAWSVSYTEEEPFGLRAVSCPSLQLCVASDFGGDILSSKNPTGGGFFWKIVTRPDGLNSLLGVSCPSISFCVTGNATDILTSSAPTAAVSSWQASAPGSGFQITAVSCPSPSACAAVDNDGTVLSSKEPAQAWTITKVISGPTNGLFGISCPSTSLCVGAGVNGQIISSGEPFGSLAVSPTGKRSTRRRLRTTITSHPRYRTLIHRRRIKVHFRFRANARARVFKCKLDRHPAFSCRPPKIYRPSVGRHTFRVWAISLTGLAGPKAAFHFSIVRK